jgi:hypothetical protein
MVHDGGQFRSKLLVGVLVMAWPLVVVDMMVLASHVNLSSVWAQLPRPMVVRKKLLIFNLYDSEKSNARPSGPPAAAEPQQIRHRNCYTLVPHRGRVSSGRFGEVRSCGRRRVGRAPLKWHEK